MFMQINIVLSHAKPVFLNKRGGFFLSYFLSGFELTFLYTKNFFWFLLNVLELDCIHYSLQTEFCLVPNDSDNAKYSLFSFLHN